ncbi:Asp-tRNA(Asn)/Glu-tRNA(Gln) amidotransferase GatCAB subunit B [bacterium]|jgi:aspartyl-tRNA(Asn)/glutamyl-tRNA(Gln) amidotransferase subunit B|nr:Asp-tRNA(Asn)/Glu-tRNA(Gln) amidotransferase GatCAB subunit B [bacterium]MDP6659729.1 Asp-tRNA(Asn)/Glu-tRNA(Gln) amidotransferase subunit GatB [Candidatus Paceibacterota bacterium]|tara:strand:- start:2493 stop:3917 length:1425 start_codon:yes stop_codon:yes gene_type:complete
MEYKPTIGLEIHAELKTKTKMFCDSRNDPDEKNPNVNICPVCTAQPGTLPAINKEAVKSILKVGTALSGELADHTEFDRKNYFYPDLPKGYQISQYKHPLVSKGELLGIEITRVHLEEDTARSSHTKGGDRSVVDFNRAGIPLMELVTEPVIESAEEAGAFARELQLLLRSLNVGDANMEKGEMRVEANISVSKTKRRGVKVEVKNLNSFRSVERAITYEIKRQIKLLEGGKEVIQETRGWNEDKQETFAQRLKEGSEDYRYFPDPDLPKLIISEITDFRNEVLKDSMPELPWERRERYVNELGLKLEDAEVFVRNSEFSNFFENYVLPKLNNDKKLIILAANYLTTDVVGILTKSKNAKLENIQDSFADLISFVGNKEMSSRGVKELLPVLLREGGRARDVANKLNFFQKSDETELKSVIEEIIEENPSVIEDYKSGKETALKFLIGKGMAKTRGSGNPEIIGKMLKRAINQG